MAITFKSVGHFFATFYQKVKGDLPKVQATEGIVEAVTAKVPVYGAIALPIEKLAYAVLGDVAGVLNALDAAGKAKLANAGLDEQVIAAVQDLVKSEPQVAALAKAL